jgi:hypothetical protein
MKEKGKKKKGKRGKLKLKGKIDAKRVKLKGKGCMRNKFWQT